MGNCIGSKKSIPHNSLCMIYKRLLQEGGESTVYKCTIEKFKNINSIKCVSLDNFVLLIDIYDAYDVVCKEYKYSTGSNEIDMLLLLSECEYIVKLIGYNRSHACIITELCTTDLFQWLNDYNVAITDDIFWIIYNQLLNAIQYCHSKNIVHCDIKMENIALLNNIHDIKLLDFNNSIKVESGKKYKSHTLMGTKHYTAPEVISLPEINGEDLYAIDYWELGVVLYIIVCRAFPFHHNDSKKMRRNIIHKKHKWTSPNLQVSPDVIDIVDQLLCKNPKERIKKLS